VNRGGGRDFGNRIRGDRRFSGRDFDRQHFDRGGRRHAGRDHDGRHWKHRHRHRDRFFFYGAPYWAYGVYAGGGCHYLYRRAIATGSPYWWSRYHDCIGYDYF
jgi:hypothetical protein